MGHVDEMLKSLSLMHAEGAVIELRVIGKPTYSGYFRVGSVELTKALESTEGTDAVLYQVMNEIDNACYSRAQQNRIIKTDTTTNDGNITARCWVLIDCDPERVAGVSATDAEKEAARQTMRKVYKHLKALDFSEPIIADSGNGFHLLYKVHVPNTPEITEVLTRFLKVIDAWFTTDEVKIDKAVFNPSRITKVYGTVARKGADSPERPHRQSKVIYVPEELKTTSFSQFELVANEWVDEAQTKAASRGKGDFDVEAFMLKYGLDYTKRIDGKEGRKYILKECPFNHDHKAPDSAIFVMNSGAIAFKCLHNSCANYKWRDVRLKFEPNAYDYSPREIKRPKEYKVPEPPAEGEEASPVIDAIVPRLSSVPMIDRSKLITLKSGFAELDNLINGFNKGELTVWSGANGSGKSTIIGQVALSAVDQGYKVVMFSGEMGAGGVKEWIYLQAAGKHGIEPDPMFKNRYRLRAGFEADLDRVVGDNIALYNNDLGLEFETVMNALCGAISAMNADVVIIDNLMSFSYAEGDAKYDAQARITKALCEVAKQYNVHIHFICHPRKTVGFLRKTDISGTSDITNLAFNIIMVHRVNQDFKKSLPEIYGKKELESIDKGGYQNVLEIMKNRDLGVSDTLVKLYYEPTIRSMYGIKGRLPRYSWQEEYIEVPKELGCFDDDGN